MVKIAFPHPPGSGGPGSFQLRFENELKIRNFEILYPNSPEKPDLVFVVGGTKKIAWLIKCKKRKIPIIFRLDGLNWLHRKRKSGRTIETFFRSEVINLTSKFIHAYIADYIIYQSKFTKEWWDLKGWTKNKRNEIIYNGVDLSQFFPARTTSVKALSLICLEGSIDYSPFAVELINKINEKLNLDFKIYGGFRSKNERLRLSRSVNYLGIVERKDLTNIYQNCIYLSLDVNASCPNTVIEALSCGAPVVGFDTGSLKELVPEEAGIIVQYGGDPWKLDFPDMDALVDAIERVNLDYKYFSNNARTIAKERYSIDGVMEKYLKIIRSIQFK